MVRGGGEGDGEEKGKDKAASTVKRDSFVDDR
jgi:hypothetical protein